jgi:hypothetical protein
MSRQTPGPVAHRFSERINGSDARGGDSDASRFVAEPAGRTSGETRWSATTDFSGF